MAKLFLSYSRKDEARARRFTEWLEHEGHDVWRDEDDIGGGASFSTEIETALSECDAVLALWSTDSVKSAWVRDEASYGRDRSKLIPFSLDGTEPPLGFRQFQSIDLSKWRGRGEPLGADRIRGAIERISGNSASHCRAVPVARTPARPVRRLSRNMLIAALLVLVGTGALGLFFWHPWSSDRQVAIAILPAPQSSDRTMAADYANAAAADMAAFLPRRFDRATVIAPADAAGRTYGYRMKISTDPHGAGADATLTLSDEDGGTTLWSQNWSVTDASAADLKAEVSAAASKAALCLTDARGGSSRLSQPALGLYLNGCTGLADGKLSNIDFVRMFERVIKLAPGFGPAWDYLAESRSWSAKDLQDSSPTAYAAALQSAREAIAVARKLNPDSGMSYDAEYYLISNDTFRGLQVLERGAKIDPDNGLLQMDLSNELISVGRMSDSVQAAQRAIELEPSTPYARSQYIQALVYSGEFSKAKEDIAAARKKWPNDQQIDFAEFGFQFRYGDPRIALQLMPRIGDLTDAEMAPNRKFIAARLDPTPAKIDDAIAALNARSANSQPERNRVLLALGKFGRVDQAYQLMEDPKFQPFIASDVLFRPDFAAVRADPRFMAVAARLGLIRYWQTSGYWPDFCSREKLRYDCKSEAAKYPN